MDHSETGHFRPFEIRTTKTSGFRMFGIRIPTVISNNFFLFQVHGDVFRPSANPLMFSALVTISIQNCNNIDLKS